MAKAHIEIAGSRIKFDEDLQRLYDDFNRLYFKYKLPYVRCGWSVARKDKIKFYGSTIKIDVAAHCFYIQINPLFKDWDDTVCTTMLHEMIHVKLQNRGHHGPKFRKEMRRLTKMGAFDAHL